MGHAYMTSSSHWIECVIFWSIPLAILGIGIGIGYFIWG